MQVFELLEYLANNAHFMINIDGLVDHLPKNIQLAFNKNDSRILRNELRGIINLADKNTIFYDSD